MKNPAITDILNCGIDAKRSGQYSTALNYYYEAMRISKTDVRIYGNLFRLQIGLGQYQEALKNLLTICGLNRFYWLSESKDPIVQKTVLMVLPQFQSSKTLYINNNNEPVYYNPEKIPAAIKADPFLLELIYRADNLTYYIGHALIGARKEIFTSQKVPSTLFLSLNDALLGIGKSLGLRDHNLFGLFLCTGFIFAHLNANTSLKTEEEVVDYYYSPLFKMNLNIENY